MSKKSTDNMPSGFARKVQRRTARISASASAARGSEKGTIKKARHFLGELKLIQFGTDRQNIFERNLDKQTKGLMRTLPPASRSWGLSRKLLNIFLRDCLYTRYLYDHYDLGQCEPFMEIPLDKIVAQKLKEGKKKGTLPVWRGVRNLEIEDSGQFQDYAITIATKRNLHRVHLDTYWWGNREN